MLDNAICGLDFNPLGTLMATIDEEGVCLISDVNTNDYSYHIKTDANPNRNLSSFYWKKNIVQPHYQATYVDGVQIQVKNYSM